MAANVAKTDQHSQSERTDLGQALSRLTVSDPLIYGRPIAATSGGAELLSVVLREIDETMLPREILVESQSFGTMRLSVSNRRLAAIAFDHDVETVTRAVPENTGEMARQFADTLLSTLSGCKDARILRPRRLAVDSHFNMSCSAQSLADAAGLADVSVPKVSTPKAPADFFGAVQSVASAVLKTGPAQVNFTCKGASQDVDLLREFYRNFRENQAEWNQKQRFNGQDAHCLIVPLSLSRMILLASNEQGHALAIVPRSLCAKLTSAWHASQ